MSPEPAVKKVVAFVDGQDLFHAAREAFGTAYPSYDPVRLARAVSFSPASRNPRGINKTDWIRIDRGIYDACVDPRDYRNSPS